MDKQRFRGILAAAVIIGIAAWFGGCDGDNNTGTPSVKYTGQSGTATVKLTFTGHTSPTDGDSFTLQVGDKIATGNIVVSSGTIIFMPKSGNQFSATISDEGVNFRGARVTFDGEENETTVTSSTTKQEPSSSKDDPVEPSPSVLYTGTGTNAPVNITLRFTGHTSPRTGDSFFCMMQIGSDSQTSTGTITVSGSTITFNPTDGGNPFTATLSGQTIILYTNDGSNSEFATLTLQQS